jgi:Tol biopolymer transport system component
MSFSPSFSSERPIAALAGIVLAGIGCMKADRLVAVQLDASSRWAPFSAPTLATGLVSVLTNVHGPSMPADEQEIFLSVDLGSVSGTGADIYTSTRASSASPWNPAVIVNELSSAGNDVDPDVSTDGLTLYLSSDRAGAGNRLYVSHRIAKGQPWGAPQEMLGLGATTSDIGPSVEPDGLFMAFARGTADIGLYSATRTDPNGAWVTVVEMSSINSGLQDENPAIFDQSLSLVWSSRRTNNGQTSDLFQISRSATSVPFAGSPIPLAPLNTPSWEGDPWVSQDGHHIMFVSDRNAGISQIFEAWR